MKLSHTIRVIHRWLGLVAAVFLILVAVSGSVLTYRDELQRWLDPDFHVVPAAAQPLSADALVALVATAYPERRVTQVWLPSRDDAPANIWLDDGSYVAVDPGSGRLIGRRPIGSGWLGKMGGFHATLLAGRLGGIFVGVLGLVLLAEIATGLIRWWPSRTFWVRGGRGARRFTFELHNASGFWSIPVLVLNTLSGILISFGVLGDKVLRRIEPAPPAPQVTIAAREAPRAPIDSLLVMADRVHAGTTRGVQLPSRPDRPAVVMKTYAGSGGREPNVRVLLDPYTAEPVGVAQPALEGSLRHRYSEIRIGLHSGEIAHEPGRLLTFLLGPMLVLQAVTGVLYWWQARQPARGPTGGASAAGVQ